mgnify:CR=1 FL=1
MKAKIYFLAMAFVALLMVGCSDDDGMTFPDFCRHFFTL